MAVALSGPPAAAVAPPEFAAITTACTGVVEAPSDYSPLVYITLYNLPSGASPTVSATISSGDITAPFPVTTPLNAVPQVANAYYTINSQSVSAFRGEPVTISLTFSDGVGGGGSLGQLVGIPTCSAFGGQSPVTTGVGMAATPAGTGYWTAATDGAVFGHGQSYDYGDLTYVPLNAPIVGMASTADGEGYWLLGRDGGVFSFGTAHFYGSTGSLKLNAPVVGMAATPDGGGYWLVASDGGVFAYGDAQFYGSMGGQHLNRPIVGMAVDQATGGYWLVALDGGIFSFNAPFHGSAGSLVLNSPIVGMEAAPDGSGYRLAASDGGVFSYNLPFAGNYVDQDPEPIVGIAGQADTGYWLTDSCGGVASFGSAQSYGQSGGFCH